GLNFNTASTCSADSEQKSAASIVVLVSPRFWSASICRSERRIGPSLFVCIASICFIKRKKKDVVSDPGATPVRHAAVADPATGDCAYRTRTIATFCDLIQVHLFPFTSALCLQSALFL